MGSLKRLAISLATTCIFLAILLISAGRFDYWQGWAYAGISLIMNFVSHMILRNNPELAQERSKPGSGTKEWDKKLLGLGLLLSLASLVIAGLDSGRCHWTPAVSWLWFFPGLILSLGGMFVFLLALKENRFFSAVVRIQKDRSQTVCRTGPYKVVRHPGNAGMIVGTMALPLLFLSLWCAVPVLISMALLVVRTHLEDRLLSEELEGYSEYQRETRYRLIPGIW